jgi:hypothetical protein
VPDEDWSQHGRRSARTHRGAHRRGASSLGARGRRTREIKIDLDRYWDLLRRRRSSERSGGDPDAVGLRDEGTVENYLQ